MKSKTRKRKTYPRQYTVKKSSSRLPWLISCILLGLVIYLHFHTSQKIIHKPSASKTPPVNESQYEFYNLLSSQEENSVLPKDKPSQEIQNTPLFLEIARFKNYKEADQLKAQLTLMDIDHVSILKSAKGAFYRVISGPYSSKAEAIQIQRQLKNNSLSAKLLSLDN
jgi:cell division protein FtsN